MPIFVLFQCLSTLIGLVIPGSGIYLLYQWYRERRRTRRDLSRLGRDRDFRWTGNPKPLLLSQFFLAFAFLGRPLVLWLFAHPGTDDDPRSIRDGEVHKIQAPDGTELHVEIYGSKDGPPLLLIPGWGPDSTVWYYAIKELGDRYRLILWDLPGLGNASPPPDNNFDFDRLAAYIALLLPLAEGKPCFLLGHSVGAMLILTFSRLFPEALHQRVAGIVLLHPTYTYPARTTFLHDLPYTLQRAVVVPSLYSIIVLDPLIRLINWLSYFNGSLLLATIYLGYAGTQTRGQLDFLAEFYTRVPPGILARGTLAGLKFDERATLSTLTTPTLVIVGDKDRLTIPEAGATIARLVPSAELVTLSPANHGGFLEQHEQFADAVSRFIETHRNDKAPMAEPDSSDTQT